MPVPLQDTRHLLTFFFLVFGLASCVSACVSACVTAWCLRSTDGGRTWSSLTSAGARDWTGVALSGDSTLWVAVVGSQGDGGNILTSSNEGASWVAAAVCAREWTRVPARVYACVSMCVSECVDRWVARMVCGEAAWLLRASSQPACLLGR